VALLAATSATSTPHRGRKRHMKDLAERIRALLEAEGGRVTEQRIFGGLAFLVNGNMAVAASGQGGLLVRADPDRSDRLLGPGVGPMVMRGRPMAGWLRVEDDAVRTKRQLSRWVRVGTTYAASLRPKSNR
jgi:TfoX/Sxy family transcriptional regulator of competence genes